MIKPSAEASATEIDDLKEKILTYIRDNPKTTYHALKVGCDVIPRPGDWDVPFLKELNELKSAGFFAGNPLIREASPSLFPQ